MEKENKTEVVAQEQKTTIMKSGFELSIKEIKELPAFTATITRGQFNRPCLQVTFDEVKGIFLSGELKTDIVNLLTLFPHSERGVERGNVHCRFIKKEGLRGRSSYCIECFFGVIDSTPIYTFINVQGASLLLLEKALPNLKWLDGGKTNRLLKSENKAVSDTLPLL